MEGGKGIVEGGKEAEETPRGDLPQGKERDYAQDLKT